MQVSDVFLGLGEDALGQLVRTISLGKLKTFQLFDRVKVRLRLDKLNSESLRRCTPRLWARLQEGEPDLAAELAQIVLVSHLDMIAGVLDFLSIPHEEGFFSKDLDPAPYLTDDWEARVYEHFKDKYAPYLVLFYINHLAAELVPDSVLYLPGATQDQDAVVPQ